MSAPLAAPPGRLHRRAPRREARRRSRRVVVLATAALLVLLLAVLACSIAVGAREVPVLDVLRAELGAPLAVDPDERYIVLSMRVPRSLIGLAVGAALGVAGALVQALTRNPLADTGILGVDAGAAFSITVGIALTGVVSISGYAWFAFAGALVTTVAVHLIGATGRSGPDPLCLVLAGLALGAVLSGITGMVTLADPDTFDAMRSWTVGTLENRGTAHLLPMLPYLGAGGLLALVCAGSLNALALGDEVATSHGVPVRAVRIAAIAAITLLAGSAVAICGPIGFVGLMVPHVIRWCVGPDQARLLPLSALGGAVLLLAADVLGRVLVAPAEMPAGVVTAFVGAPVLIVLVRARRRLSGL
ncbi:FecCD family ABC transporter permease [Brachybacterium tyrofermentans]|uniref:FecCD family ABC transporter permease n=1 Tax=Brachybacterium tyrofermentans TaxID=47848 RepID=UPI003F8F51DD